MLPVVFVGCLYKRHAVLCPKLQMCMEWKARVKCGGNPLERRPHTFITFCFKMSWKLFRNGYF